MQKQRGSIRAATALLLIAVALAAFSGCKPSLKAKFGPDGSRTAEQTASVAATATGAVDAQSGSGAGGTSGAGGGSSGGSGSSASKLSPKDASSLDAELSAIQSELDRLSVPSDSDFDSIGSGLQ